MDSSSIARYLSKLESRKIKCSKAILSQISPVFGKMFNETWLKESTIELDDAVTFDPYSTFKIFMEIVYELRKVDSLSLDESTAVHFYSHKYQVMDVTNKIQSHWSKEMIAFVSQNPMSVDKINDALQFAELYQLGDFKEKLDKVKVVFNKENPVQFFDLAVKFQLDSLKQQVIQHLKTREPNDTWTLEISNSVVTCIQEDVKELREAMLAIRRALNESNNI